MPKDAIKGKCSFCEKRIHLQKTECLTCEKLGKEFSVISCRQCREKGIHKIRQHALVKHPSNLLRVCAAALRGE